MVTDTITIIINEILVAKDVDPVSPERSTELYAQDGGLAFDSLDTAELSIRLEQAFGHDPFSKSIFPQTFGELLDYYQQK